MNFFLLILLLLLLPSNHFICVLPPHMTDSRLYECTAFIYIPIVRGENRFNPRNADTLSQHRGLISLRITFGVRVALQLVRFTSPNYNTVDVVAGLLAG